MSFVKEALIKEEEFYWLSSNCYKDESIWKMSEKSEIKVDAGGRLVVVYHCQKAEIVSLS